MGELDAPLETQGEEEVDAQPRVDVAGEGELALEEPGDDAEDEGEGNRRKQIRSQDLPERSRVVYSRPPGSP